MTIYASRTAESLNSDPLPWVHDTGARTQFHFVCHGQCTPENDPRPEYTPQTTHEANPILVDVRYWAEQPETTASSVYRSWLSYVENDEPENWAENVAPEHIDHARRVLGRLAAFTKEG